MDTIVRRWNRNIQTHYVYTKEEADNKGLVYKPWREAQPKDWALTDDGYVVECLRACMYPGNGKTVTEEKVFSVTRLWVHPKTRLDYLPLKATGNFTGKIKRSWQETEARRTRTRNTIAVYAQQILSGKVDYEQLGRVYRPDQQIPAATVRRLLKQTRIQAMVREELKKLLAAKGLDESYVLDVMKRAVDIAEDLQDPTNMLRGAKELAELLGMKEQRQVQAMFTVDATLERQLAAAEAETTLLEE